MPPGFDQELDGTAALYAACNVRRIEWWDGARLYEVTLPNGQVFVADDWEGVGGIVEDYIRGVGWLD